VESRVQHKVQLTEQSKEGGSKYTRYWKIDNSAQETISASSYSNTQNYKLVFGLRIP